LRPLTSIFNFQLKQAVNKRNMLVFLVIAVILQVFLQVGKANHNDILESKDTYQRHEKQKASRYLHYTQYGSFGIQLLIIPHVNCILYFDSTCDNLLCNADSTYVFNTYTSVKGRRLFANRSRFLNFSAMFLLFGVLACLVYGKDTIVRKDYLKFISNLTGSARAFWFTVTARLMILFLAALVLYGISVLPLLVFDGINLFSASYPSLFIIILVFLFFFSIGCVVGFKKSQFTRILILGAVYFISVILLPWVMDLYAQISAKDLPPLIEYDFQNFNVLMQEEEKWDKKYGPPKSNEDSSDDEIKDFKEIMIKMKKIFRRNEDILKSQTMAKIKTQKTISAFFPPLFYFSTCESSSGTGVDAYMDFHTYCQETKEGFVDFVIDKTFPGKDQPLPKVESFLKGDEDLFFSKPKLPYNFGLGVFLTPFYTALLLLLTFSILKKRLKVPSSTETYRIEQEKDNPLFVLCENVSIKEDIFNYYRSQKGSVCLEKIDTGDFQFYGVKPHELFNHFCQASGVDEKKALENLSQMGIKDLTGLPVVCHEITSKMIAAVKTAGDFDLIVMNDFLKNESREMEKDLFNLLLFLEKSGKKIIYLSCQMKQSNYRLTDKIKIDGFKSFPLELISTSLR